MSETLPAFPAPPDWRVDWDALNAEYPCLHPLRGCPQEPTHHGEGDAWVHTRMVCEAMANLPAWQSLSDDFRSVLFAAAMLHDIGKPDCTRTDADGKITARGHALRGSILARRILWEMGVPFETRERVVSLVRHHMRAFYLFERDDSTRLAAEISQTTRCDHLAILAEADARGRIATDQQRLLDNVALLVEFCRDAGCLDRPLAFPSEHGRFLYFHAGNRQPDSPAHMDYRAETVLMSGLPGSGKDTHIAAHFPDWPVISLDALREEMDVEPDEAQGAVINRAREMARDYLRSGTSFVWNATNVSRVLRRQSIALFAAYQARIKIVYVEAPPEVLHRQNRQRSAIVPEKVMARFLDRWEVPDLTEAHEVQYVVRN